MCIHVYSRVYDCIQTQRSEQTPPVYIATDLLGHNSHIQCVNLGACHDHLKMTHKWSIQYCWDSNIWRQSNIFQPFQKKQAEKQYDTFTYLPAVAFLHMVSCGFVIWCLVDLFWIKCEFLCYHMVSCGHMWGRDVDSPRFEVIESPRNTVVMDNREYLKVVKYRDREILRWWTDASI